MNRIILLGNGFDLAHGLQTSYISFIKWYIKDCFFKAIEGEYSDCLIEIQKNHKYRGSISVDKANVESWLDKYFEDEEGDLTKLGPYHSDYSGYAVIYPFLVAIQSYFLTDLLDQYALKRWVDVEAVFYDQLNLILELKRETHINSHIAKQEELLGKLNCDMREITKQLETYLLTIDKPIYNEGYEEIFKSEIKLYDLDSKSGKHYVKKGIINETPSSTLILNFNYTDTAEQYLKSDMSLSASKFTINYIHGQLGNSYNPIVFGFGDELDDKYLLMEREKAKGYFEHIKSFWYFRTPNYKDLVRYTESGDYQVYILGHSCGLSDRTMLHMILEHENCKSIKIYHHGNESHNNYTNITYEIARHFKDKSTMRDRIVSLNDSSNMPQVRNT